MFSNWLLGSWGEQNPRFVACANFQGINSPTVAACRLYHHDLPDHEAQCWEEVLTTVSGEPLEASPSTPLAPVHNMEQTLGDQRHTFRQEDSLFFSKQNAISFL